VEVHQTTAFKGRGAVSNRPGRFELEEAVPFDDGWDTLAQTPIAFPETLVHRDASRSIVTTNQSPDIPFEQSINPYKGCEHGCIYCYARQTHAYLGHSAGLDFETQLYAKHDGAELLEAFLRKPRYVCKPITLGANTDAYQPSERRLGITRQILEVMHAFHQPVCIITKSALVLRDLDLLQEMAQQNLVKVAISITTRDPKLARIMEPRAAAPHRRFETVATLADAGVPVTVMSAPMIPAINDHEMVEILEEAKDKGAVSAGYVLLRLPHEVVDLFTEWLETHFPQRAAHVMSLLKQMRGGKAYEATFGKRMRGQGPYADMLSQRFKQACRRLGLNKKTFDLNTSAFRPPLRPGDQMNLFEV
jgi:DNA repair photolyase